MRWSTSKQRLAFETLEARVLLYAYSVIETLTHPDTEHVYHLLAAEDGQSGLQPSIAEEIARQDFNAHLATINDQAELDFLAEGISQFYVGFGLNDTEVEGELAYFSGQPVTFTNFYQGEPNDYLNNEDFFVLYNWEDVAFGWNDVSDTTEIAGFPIYQLVEVEPAGAESTPVVQAFYVVPSDKQIRDDHIAAIDEALTDVQEWYGSELATDGAWQTFARASEVEVIRSAHPASWFASTTSGDAIYAFWQNASSEIAPHNDPDLLTAVYINADPDCGQITGAVPGLVIFPANDLRGLVSEENVPACSGELADTGGVDRWRGGLATLLASAFELSAPAPCTDDDPATACRDDTLTWTGYLAYPNAVLLAEDRTTLRGNRYFSVLRSPQAELATSNSLSSQTFVPWNNHNFPLDVNDDGEVSPVDALIPINDLNSNGSRPLPGSASAPDAPESKVDVNGDGHSSPVDALLVINEVNDPTAGPTFEIVDTSIVEGDFYYIDALNPAPNEQLELALEHNGQIVYEYDPLTLEGDSELRVIMPDVLQYRPAHEQGSAIDGYTLRIRNGLHRDAIGLEVREGLRMTIDAMDVREGGRIPFHIRNGIGESEVIADLLHDGSVVQQRRYDTDGSGKLQTEFQLERHLLEYPQTEDGFELRLAHGGKSVTNRLTIRHGLQVWTSSKNIREGHDFTIGGRGAKGETAVYVTVRIDDREYELTDLNKDTRSDGSIEVTYSMPQLITTAADRDGATISVRTTSAYNDNPDLPDEEVFEFRVTVHRGDHDEPEERTYPEDLNFPTRTPDRSAARVLGAAAEGATDAELREMVEPEVANDPLFIPAIRDTVQQRGNGPNLLTWLLLGMPRDAFASEGFSYASPFTRENFERFKAFLAVVFTAPEDSPAPTTPWSMNLVRATANPTSGVYPQTTQGFQFPTTNPHVNQSFGGYLDDRRAGHLGTDFRGSAGETTVFAVADGTVVYSGDTHAAGWGEVIIIRHDNGIFSMYAHLQDRRVGTGAVTRGLPIATVGPEAEGSTGAHLHFEIRTGGRAMEPNLPGYAGDAFDSPSVTLDGHSVQWYDACTFILLNLAPSENSTAEC